MYRSTCTISIFLLTLFGLISTVSANTETRAPTALEAATEAYEKLGVDAFIPALYGAPLTSPNLELLNGTSVLLQVEKLYGSYTGLEIIKNIQLSNSTRTVFFIMKYEKGPLFGVITTYRQTNEIDQVMEFKINIERTKILPTRLIF